MQIQANDGGTMAAGRDEALQIMADHLGGSALEQWEAEMAKLEGQTREKTADEVALEQHFKTGKPSTEDGDLEEEEVEAEAVDPDQPFAKL